MVDSVAERTATLNSVKYLQKLLVVINPQLMSVHLAFSTTYFATITRYLVALTTNKVPRFFIELLAK